jgi:hypothetical protein
LLLAAVRRVGAARCDGGQGKGKDDIGFHAWWREASTASCNQIAFLSGASFLHHCRLPPSYISVCPFMVSQHPILEDGGPLDKQQSYFELYASAAHALKAASPKLKVGGPATCCANCWLEDFVTNMDVKGIPYDFISTHAYEYRITLRLRLPLPLPLPLPMPLPLPLPLKRNRNPNPTSIWTEKGYFE